MEVSGQSHTPGEIAFDTHWLGCCVGPKAILAAVKRKSRTPSGTSAIQLVANRYTNRDTPQLILSVSPILQTQPQPS